jgi:hypothetical protein
LGLPWRTALDDGLDLSASTVLAAEIVDDLRAALEEFELIGADLARPAPPRPPEPPPPAIAARAQPRRGFGCVARG